MGKQSQLLLQPTEVELGLQVGVEFDNIYHLLSLKNLKQLGKFKEKIYMCFLQVNFYSPCKRRI